MTVRKFTLKTQSDYIRVIKNFTIFLGRSPDTASNEDLRRFQLHLSEKRVGAPTINLTISALRFFFTVTLDRTDAVKHLTFVAEPPSLAKSPDKKSGLNMPGGNMRYVSTTDRCVFTASRLALV
jgi:integrase/recombinase XerD